MSETRKRSHSVDDDKVILKKHIISDENGSPRVNGLNTGQNDDVEPTGDDKLEVNIYAFFSCPF
jgi:E3 ubiquitin-protein ligase BRE1